MKIYYVWYSHERIHQDQMTDVDELLKEKQYVFFSEDETKVQNKREQLLDRYGDRDDWDVSSIYSNDASDLTDISVYPRVTERL